MTEKQQKAYRLCHHDFEGLTTKEAAEVMGIVPGAVRQLLRNLKSAHPQLFPILTKQQHFIQQCITEKGWSHRIIAEVLKVEVSTIDTMVKRMKAKGIYLAKPNKTIQYKDWMDANVIQKF